jgi:hypothetical protein
MVKDHYVSHDIKAGSVNLSVGSRIVQDYQKKTDQR